VLLNHDRGTASKTHIFSTFENPKQELHIVLARLFDIMYPVGIIVGGIALIASVFQSVSHGWYFALFLNIGMYLFAVIVLVFRRNIPVAFMFTALLGLMALDVLYSLFNTGLTGTGITSLIFVCIFTGVLLGIRSGIVAVSAGVFVASCIGAAICTGVIKMRPDITNYLSEPITWIVQIALFVMYVIPLIIVVNGMQKRMVRGVYALEKTNKRLQTEMLTREAAEEELRKSEEKYRTVVENSLVAFYIIQDNRFLFVNRPFCTIFGYTYDEIVNTLAPVDIMHPDERKWVKEGLKGRMKGKTEIVEHECKGLRKDGKTITIKLLGGGLTYNERYAAFGTILDITNEKKLESQLRQSQKMEAIGTLTGGIAHDFNNILTVITGYTHLLQRELGGSHPLRSYVDQVLLASQKAADLTQSLLAFSRQQPVTLVPLDVNSTIKAAEKLLKRLLTEDIEFRTSLADDDMIIMADKSQMDQIIFNLVTNARDAMPKGGVLTIETSMAVIDTAFIKLHDFGKTGKYVQISISDTGEGMDEITQQKIFEPFFTTKEIGKGTGLGLATVYGIVKQNNGYITVGSSLNLGATFRVYLPVAKMIADQDQDRETSILMGNETILIAEDNSEVRHFIREALQQYGYTVREAIDGEDAVEEFKKDRNIDLIIIDSVMPKKNGLEAYAEMHNIDPHLKALFTSGYTNNTVFNKVIEEKAFDFITKPLTLDKLLQKVREVLDRQ
jgi:PAS domain S-box-containing protein